MEDVPTCMEQERRQTIPVLKAARKAGMKATMKGYKVLIEGKRYGMNDINSLPANAHPSIQERLLNLMMTGTFFSGRLSPFGYFHPANF